MFGARSILVGAQDATLPRAYRKTTARLLSFHTNYKRERWDSEVCQVCISGAEVPPRRLGG
jgi:hypothetical protein